MVGEGTLFLEKRNVREGEFVVFQLLLRTRLNVERVCPRRGKREKRSEAQSNGGEKMDSQTTSCRVPFFPFLRVIFRRNVNQLAPGAK